jgi:hypothetical protein
MHFVRGSRGTFGIMTKRGKIIFGVVGYALVGLVFVSFIFRALWHVKSGQGLEYSNYKNQPMTYLGALGSMTIAGLVVVVGLYYRLRKNLENRRNRKVQKVSE